MLNHQVFAHSNYLQKSSRDTGYCSTDPSFGIGFKKPSRGGLWRESETTNLLDLTFFVDHVFTHNRIILLNFHLIWCCPLIFGRRVKVTRAS